MTTQIRTLITDISRVLIVADATTNLPLQNDLLRLSERHLATAHSQLAEFVDKHGDDASSLPPLEEMRCGGGGESSSGAASPCPLEECFPQTYSYPTGATTAAKSPASVATSVRAKNLYTEFLSQVQPVAKNIKLVGELWRRHKGLKELEEIVTRALTDLAEMRRQEREEREGLRTVSLG